MGRHPHVVGAGPAAGQVERRRPAPPGWSRAEPLPFADHSKSNRSPNGGSTYAVNVTRSDRRG